MDNKKKQQVLFPPHLLQAMAAKRPSELDAQIALLVSMQFESELTRRFPAQLASRLDFRSAVGKQCFEAFLNGMGYARLFHDSPSAEEEMKEYLSRLDIQAPRLRENPLAPTPDDFLS